MEILHRMCIFLAIFIDVRCCPTKCLCVSHTVPSSYCNGLRLTTVHKNIAKDTEILSLQVNEIVNISDIDFKHLTSLKRLNLQFNRIEHISEDAFENQRHLQSLNLGHNNIKTISPKVFRNLVSLEELYLNNNLLEKLSHEHFLNLPSLKRLHLQWNNLQRQEYDVFAQIPNLELLNLAHNKLDEVNTDMFKNTKKLKSILLDNNAIGRIDSNAFHELSDLSEVTLENNSLATLSVNLFRDKPSLNKISFYNNPFHCNCKNYWMHEALTNGWPAVVNIEKITCRYSWQAQTNFLGELTREQFNCHGSWGEWENWSNCNKPCSNEMRHRTRLCYTNARSDYSGACEGDASESERCNTSCSFGVLANWEEWSECLTWPKSFYQIRKRLCLDPITNLEMTKCLEPHIEMRPCAKSTFPVRGSWSEWGSWSTCDKECGLGIKTRERKCIYFESDVGRHSCNESELQKQKLICFKALCPPKTHWTEWSPFSECSSFCGKGSRTRSRVCQNEFNLTVDILNLCPGESNEATDCYSENELCKFKESWSQWSSWSACNIDSCKRNRSRTCVFDSTMDGGRNCAGEYYEEQACTPSTECSIYGQWNTWQEWSPCSHSCDLGYKKRKRLCLSANVNKLKCGERNEQEEDEQIQECNLPKCNEAKWSAWEEWSGCISRVKELRKRLCIGENEFNHCEGREKEKRSCKLENKQKEVVTTGKTTSCVPRYHIPNGKEVIKKTLNGIRAFYSCNKFYRLKGSQPEINCIKGKGWERDESPYCVPICGKPVHKSTGNSINRARLLGGSLSVAHSWPWQVAIEVKTRKYGWRLFCGGSLLGDKWIVTAGHCLFDTEPIRRYERNEFKIFLGIHNISKRYEDSDLIYEANYAEAHPNFNINSLDNDIGLIELKEKARLSDKILPICLPTSEQKTLSKSGRIGTVIGWGVTTQGKASELLKELNIPVVSRSDCINAYKNEYNITESMFCAGNKSTNEDTCKGDSGGGYLFRDTLKKKWTLQGIISWGSGTCGDAGKYSVYTHVYNFTSWLRTVMSRG